MPKIIQAMQAMGYQPNTSGVCFGIAAMSAKAVIRKSAQFFAQRIELIHNTDDTFPKTLKKEKQIELQCFFDELFIYQGPSNYPKFSKIFPKLRQDITNLELLISDSELASYNLLEENEKTLIALPKAKATFINNFTLNEFTAFVQKTVQFLNEEPFSLLISESAVNHAIQLGFDGTKWLLTNHDEIKICENTDLNIQNLLLNLFQIQSSIPSCTDRKSKTFSVSIVLSNFNQADLTQFENYDIDINLITLEFDKNVLFELMLNSQRSNKVLLLKTLIDRIKDLDPTLNLFIQALECKDSCGQSILFRAAANDQSEILNLLIEEIEIANLSEIMKASLLNAKDNMGRSSLYCAALRGYTNTAHTLLHAVNKIQLHSQKQDMISSNTTDEVSTIHMAVLGDQIKMLELLFNTVDELNISEDQKFKLITAKTCKKLTTLHIAADKGYSDTMELILNVVKQKATSEKDKLVWITEFTSCQNNALNMAARDGYTSIAKQLFKAIDDCNVDADIKEKYKGSLINLKNKKGMSASITAARFGHVEFYRYILNIYKQLYGKTISSILNFLTQKQAEGASAMCLAAESGNTDMVSFLIDTIMALKISDSHKAELIEAKRHSGACALSLATQYGHTNIINNILKTIFSMNLSEDDKFHLIEARNEKNAPALLLAVDKKDIATVKALVNFILSSDLTIETKKILLTSDLKDINLTSAYQHALNKNHLQIADYFESIVLNSQIFTNEQKSAILKNQ